MWESAKDIIRGPTSFEGTFVVPEPILDAIKTHAAEYTNNETGGMLFGKIEDPSTGTNIVVEVVHNIGENKASNTSTYFGIEQDYARKILNKYEPDYLYLGNWHSHLGYGGPSSGDRQEVGKFFAENKSRKITVDFIMDRVSKSELTYKPIIDVYRRKGEQTSDFRTYRVEHKNLKIPDSDEDSVIITNSQNFDTVRKQDSQVGNAEIDDVSPEDLVTLLRETYAISGDDIRTYRNNPYDEYVVLAPLSYERKQGANRVDVMLKVSFPDDLTENIFIDLTSPRLEKQLTINKISADTISDGESLLADNIVKAIEEMIPGLLDQPLASVISQSSDEHVVTDTGWKLCQN